MRIKIVVVGLALFLSGSLMHAVFIVSFPGLAALIREADAIVILRIDEHVRPRPDANFYSTHDCFVYQTLKGDVPAGKTIRLQLMDTRTAFASPYSISSTHLMFLTKKRTINEATEYRTIEFIGANIPLGPFGHENVPEGATARDKIANLLKMTLESNRQQNQKEEAFLEQMIKGTAEPPRPAEPSSAGAPEGRTH